MAEDTATAGSEELIGFAAGSRRYVDSRRGSDTRSAASEKRANEAGSDSEKSTPNRTDASLCETPPETHPALADATAELDLLEDTIERSVAAWMQSWQRIEALGGTAPAGSSLAAAIDALRARFLAATTANFKVTRFPDAVLATRQLVSAASAVFTGQPDAKAWPSRVGRVISATVVAADYEAIASAMREYSVKVASLDEAIKNARDQEVLWLLPEGSLRCPGGAIDIFRSEAASAHLISGTDDLPGATRLLGALAMFSTPGRSQETLTSLSAPFRLEVIEIAREAHTQLKILHREGHSGASEAALAARPFRFRGVEIQENASVTYVLMVALWIGSGAILAVMARSVPQYVLLPSGLAMVALSSLAAMQPARGAKREAWESAVAEASSAVELLQEALQVRKKPNSAGKKVGDKGDAKPRDPT